VTATGWLTGRSVHASTRQYAPSCVRSYSSRLTRGSNGVPSMLRTTSRQHFGTAHTSTQAPPPVRSRWRRSDRRSRRHLGRSCHDGALAAAARRRARTPRRQRGRARRAGAQAGSPPNPCGAAHRRRRLRPPRASDCNCWLIMSMIRVSERFRAALCRCHAVGRTARPWSRRRRPGVRAGFPASPRLRSCPSLLIAVEARSQPDADQTAGWRTRDSVLPCTHGRRRTCCGQCEDR
jgi:hypothetical protein